MNLLEVKLHGPFGLLDDAASVFAAPDAWQPGVYVWTFLYNQSDRVHRVGIAHDAVARVQAEQLRRLLAGEAPFHRAARREEGVLERCYEPGQGVQAYHAAFADLRAELNALRVFYAPLGGDDSVRERVAGAIAGHIRRLGGKAVAWFDADDGIAVPATHDLTVRIFRPVHMASMPDEINA